jgi:hypothetical protein
MTLALLALPQPPLMWPTGLDTDHGPVELLRFSAASYALVFMTFNMLPLLLHTHTPACPSTSVCGVLTAWRRAALRRR